VYFTKKKQTHTHCITDMEGAIQWKKQLFWIKIIVRNKDPGKLSNNSGRSRWPHCLGVDVSFVLSGLNLCDGLIPRPEELYRVCLCVCVCVTECNQVQQKQFTPKETRKDEKRGTNNLLLMKYLSRHNTPCIFYRITLCNFVVPTRSV